MTTGPHSHVLIQRSQAGEGEAIDELIRRHLPALRLFVRAQADPLLRAQESCSDLVQTACRQALLSLENYEWQGEGSFRQWLFSVAMNKIMRRRQYYAAEKRNQRRVATADLDEIANDQLAAGYRSVCTPSQHAVAQETVDLIEAGLDKLPENYRDVILFSKVVGLSNIELAKHLGKDAATTRVLLHRALARLGTIIEMLESGESA
jgi:RNA polymerase sigma-70 factor (ECF subfamily)